MFTHPSTFSMMIKRLILKTFLSVTQEVRILTNMNSNYLH